MPASSIDSFSLQSWGPLEKNAGKADVVFVDANLVNGNYVSQLKSQGKRVVCYISAGTLENWRDDHSKFSNAAMGQKYKGFGGKETWLDITKWETFKEPMLQRIKQADSKGCQFIEYDNTDCDINGCVPGASRQTLVAKQSEYINWLINTAHGMGMGVGLKNSQSHIPEFASKIDFAINEECQTWKECDLYNTLTKANKAVFGVEYKSHGGSVCSEAKKHSMITKYRNNGKWFNCFSM
jgi:hypothetical protein